MAERGSLGTWVQCAGVVLFGLAAASYARAVDGVIEISQARALGGGVTPGDAPGFPVSLTAAGSYRLTSELQVPDSDTTAIQVASHDVTLDLNGFSIRGPNTCPSIYEPCTATGAGVGIDASVAGGCYDRTVVTNGGVHGTGGVGIRLGCRDGRVEAVALTDVGGVGIFGGSGMQILRNRLDRVGETAIAVGDTSRVIGNSVKFSGGGITASDALVEDNVVVNCRQLGLALFIGAAYAHNVLRNNNGGDANPQVSGGIQIGSNVCGLALCP